MTPVDGWRRWQRRFRRAGFVALLAYAVLDLMDAPLAKVVGVIALAALALGIEGFGAPYGHRPSQQDVAEAADEVEVTR